MWRWITREDFNMSRTYREVCDILYDLDGLQGYNVYRERYEHPTIDDFENYVHYQNCGCEQMSRQDIPIIFRRYFYFTNRYDNLELVDLYSDVEYDPNEPRTLQELSIIMARKRLKFWLNYKMSLFSYHYCDFVKLQNTLLTTIGIQLAISN